MRSLLVGLVIIVAAMPVVADEVVFRNGDRLTGKIQTMQGGKLTISSPVAGTVQVDLVDVLTFSSDQPIEIHLKDGTVINQKVVAVPEGGFATQPGGAIQPQRFPLETVASINPPVAKWSLSLAAGVLVSRGNSYSDNVNVEADATRRTEDDRLNLKGGYFYGRQKDRDTGQKTDSADSWFLAAKYDYFLNSLYVYGNVRIERDRIADLDVRVSPGGGVGYQWIESARTNLSTEAGLSWVYEQYTNPSRTSDFIAARLAYHIDHRLNDAVKVIHNLEFLPSLQNASTFLVNADAGLRTTLTRSMFTEAKIVWQYNSQPAEGRDRNDLRYILNVGWQL